jgi:glycine betaine/proline transport system permease protein
MSVVADTADTALAVPVASRTPWWRGKVVQVAGVVSLMWLAYRAWGLEYPWPNWLVWNGLLVELDDIQAWLIDQRLTGDGGALFTVFDAFRIACDNLVEWFYDLLVWLTWLGTVTIGTALAWRFGGLRAGAWALGAFTAFAVSGLWLESMETLALMITAVTLSLLIGIPLGILCGRSARFNRALTPFLDAAQIVPAFAYLMPVVLLFSVGYAAAVVTTMLYAIPPCIRITALGIRRVPVNTVEAAASLGATGRQMLQKVQLPLSRRMILLGLNQTILFALSMVVIAGLIGGGGLGAVVNSGLFSNPALAILAGVVIVVMAMALDRITEAVADRTDPAKRHLDEAARRSLRIRSLVAAAIGIGGVVVGKALGVSGDFPDAAGVRQRAVTAQEWLLARIQSVLDYVQDPTSWVFQVTEPVGNFILQKLLLPLQAFLVEGPWFTTLAGLTLIALVVSGLRPAITTLAMLLLIGFMGVWALAMDTLSQVLVATLLAVLVGVGMGVWASESRVVSRGMRPVNDVLQTLPQLVYIIPFIYLMPVSIVPGIVAAVLYAFPVVERLVERGIRDVAPESVEAAGAFGATRGQVLRKVKIPLAGDAIMLGVNQGIIMVLAVVVIGGLVGSGGLGYEVAQGLVRGQFGQGVIASVAILALGIALDRVTQGTRRARKEGIE